MFNLGDDDGEFLVGLHSCDPGTENLALVRLTMLYLDYTGPAEDLMVCITGAHPASFGPGVPGYSQCDGRIRAFGVAQNGLGFYPDGCLVINPSQDTVPIAAEVSSFGTMKARF